MLPTGHVPPPVVTNRKRAASIGVSNQCVCVDVLDRRYGPSRQTSALASQYCIRTSRNPRLRVRWILDERHAGHAELAVGTHRTLRLEVAEPARVDRADGRPGQPRLVRCPRLPIRQGCDGVLPLLASIAQGRVHERSRFAQQIGR